ncbi:MAG: cytochrome c-type biogenesis protein CcmH [Actinobacteria bacterium]|nr:cytochrome c-type biogenesis protein CcmH [Actinomycetota bacterium]
MSGAGAIARPRSKGRVVRAGGLLAVALLAVAASLAVMLVRGPEAPRTLQGRVTAVAAELRCPVCQNLSVADSSSKLAQQMRATIARDLRAGRTPEQIRDQFVAAYGEWILLSPSRRGINLVAWIVPFLLVVLGLAGGVITVRRWRAHGVSGPASAPGAQVAPAEHLSSADRRLLEWELSRLGEEPE